MEFPEFFRRATGKDPFPFQVHLATTEPLPVLLDIPTGLGKTAASVLEWFWRRRFAGDAILIGTQDMLLSRALNRCFGASCSRWPIHFGLTNTDCLSVRFLAMTPSSGTEDRIARERLQLGNTAGLRLYRRDLR